MRSPLLFAAAVVAAGALVAARPPAAHGRDAEAAEVRRIRAHFDSVLRELPARDLSGLTVAQRGRRSALLGTLAAYRDRGLFPHNYDFPGQAVPYFVDRKTGVRCAVAHLLAASGRGDIVERVARAGTTTCGCRRSPATRRSRRGSTRRG